MSYDDGKIACDERGLTIRWYYLWGAKRVPWTAIRGATTRPLTGVRGRWRIWGSGDFRHWYNLDAHRSRKQTAIELDTGGRVRPTITPDDPDTVMQQIQAHTGSQP